MIGIELKDFQEWAVAKLRNIFFSPDSKQTTIFSAPTGSGKTVILIELMDSIIENNPNDYDYAFVWLTPGNGELEEQSYKSTLDKASLSQPQLLSDALTNGFTPQSVTFINWEQVTKKGNIATKDGEVINLFQRITEAQQQNIHFVVLVDEEHRNRNNKTQTLINSFSPDKIIRTSATPQSRGKAYELVQVDEEDVIRQGMITRSVILNVGVNEGDNISNPVSYFLDLADEKRLEIKQKYQNLNKNINPLVLIQLPDEKQNGEYMEARSELIQNIEEYLQEIGQQENQIARWLSGDHFNTEAIEKNDSQVNYLLMKQAVSTGWDAPRAKILVTLRLNMDVEFTLQTIGRIRRMPEQQHYDDELLDNSFVFSNDTKYINKVLEDEEGCRIAQYTLNPEVPNFNLTSIKSNELAKMTLEETTRSYWYLLTQKYNLSQDKRDYHSINKRKLADAGYVFSESIIQRVGQSSNLMSDLQDDKLNYIEVNSLFDVKKNRLTLLDREQDIQKYLHTSSPANVHAILVELFSDRGEGIFVPPILRLKNIELMSFIINNYNLLRDDAKEMDSNNLNLFNANSHLVDPVPFSFAELESYKVVNDKIKQKNVFRKNVYQGYSEANWVGQSLPEIQFEIWLEKSEHVQWWYRNFDHGDQYFSIAYGAKKVGFFPDYLVQGSDGKIYIIETKGGKNADIDTYSSAKFNALKNYIQDSAPEKKFAFVRPDGQRLVYSDTEYEKAMTDHKIWKPIELLFES